MFCDFIDNVKEEYREIPDEEFLKEHTGRIHQRFESGIYFDYSYYSSTVGLRTNYAKAVLVDYLKIKANKNRELTADQIRDHEGISEEHWEDGIKPAVLERLLYYSQYAPENSRKDLVCQDKDSFLKAFDSCLETFKDDLMKNDIASFSDYVYALSHTLSENEKAYFEDRHYRPHIGKMSHLKTMMTRIRKSVSEQKKQVERDNNKRAREQQKQRRLQMRLKEAEERKAKASFNRARKFMASAAGAQALLQHKNAINFAAVVGPNPNEVLVHHELKKMCTSNKRLDFAVIPSEIGNPSAYQAYNMAKFNGPNGWY